MHNLKIFLFAYDFNHKKSCKFMEILANHGFNVIVLAAPRKVLKHNLNFIEESNAFDTKETSKKYGFEFISTPHDNFKLFSDLIKKEKQFIGLIAGARIISEEIINLFNNRIINFHPGKIPETSGLDSFYWMIRKNVAPGITVHSIDKKVDAGKQYFFHAYTKELHKDINLFRSELFDFQFQALERFLKILKKNLQFETEVVKNPSANKKLSAIEIAETKNLYSKYREKMNKKNSELKQAFLSVKADALNNLEKISHIKDFEIKNSFGRTLLSEASYYKSIDCVKYLLKQGYNPNTQNDNGTTPLMYAKSNINVSKRDKKIIETIDLLIEYGANPNTKDFLGKDIFHYLKIMGNSELVNKLK